MSATWRGLVAGALCVAVVVGGVAASLHWWELSSRRSVDEREPFRTFVECPVGNPAACDAAIREFERERERHAAVKAEVAKMLAAGSTKREAVNYAMKHGLFGYEAAEAVGISPEDLRDDKF
jgi:hypothetical protein